ncbi:hypothetical protein DFH06DRAFT_1135723 [Mycena polygramma]|nr:hypothetical protein DFH06DRAFT_1135723 [Mycena polygramma]
MQLFKFLALAGVLFTATATAIPKAHFEDIPKRDAISDIVSYGQSAVHSATPRAELRLQTDTGIHGVSDSSGTTHVTPKLHQGGPCQDAKDVAAIVVILCVSHAFPRRIRSRLDFEPDSVLDQGLCESFASNGELKDFDNMLPECVFWTVSDGLGAVLNHRTSKCSSNSREVVSSRYAFLHLNAAR